MLANYADPYPRILSDALLKMFLLLKWPEIFKKWNHTYQGGHHYCGNTVAHHSQGCLPLHTDDQYGCQRTAGHGKLVNQPEMENN